jgi:hypothetical protein
MMHKFVCGLCALASMAWAFPVHAQATGPAQAAAPAIELAFMPQTATVTLLNEGGKWRKPRDNACTLCCGSDQRRRMPIFDDV